MFLQTTMTETEDELWPLLVFQIGKQRYALPIDHVIEVAAMVELMTVPDSPPELIGVANRRGEVLHMLDLRLVLGPEAKEITAATLFIVAQHENQRIGLVVDTVNQVEYINRATTHERNASGKYIQSIISHKSVLIQIIALSSLMETFLPESLTDEINYE